jgi:hypothetical protein
MGELEDQAPEPCLGATAIAMVSRACRPSVVQNHDHLVSGSASGKETSLPFTAQINFDAAQVTATGLPNDARSQLSASAAPLVVPIAVTNAGGLVQAYFADARIEGSPVPMASRLSS